MSGCWAEALRGQPVLHVLLPGVVLLLMRVRPAEMGLRIEAMQQSYVHRSKENGPPPGW